MKSSHARFTGSVPANYDRFLGPLLFEFTAADMARRVSAALEGPANILEVACGTGISTRHLAEAAPQGSRIRATDLNDAMLAHAQEANGQLAGVTYSQADALDLPFGDASFDAVVCQFGIMFFPDRAKGMREMARVLKPGGTLALNVWNSFAENRSVEVVDRAIKQAIRDDPPQFLEVPFEMNDPALCRSLFREAGFADIQVDRVAGASRVDDHLNVARGFITGNPTILEIQGRDDVELDAVIEHARQALEAAFGPAPVRLEFAATVFAAQKP